MRTDGGCKSGSRQREVGRLAGGDRERTEDVGLRRTGLLEVGVEVGERSMRGKSKGGQKEGLLEGRVEVKKAV